MRSTKNRIKRKQYTHQIRDISKTFPDFKTLFYLVYRLIYSFFIITFYCLQYKTLLPKFLLNPFF